ncbi:MAG: MerR family transcriptional regulator [Gammaproteobacteria bacterium]|jgi:DNA-binding transcriptional MerR regulator
MSHSGKPTDPPVFPIRTVSALTGVAAGTLRAWERRYGFINPERTASGHRLYSRRDVERIQQASELIQSGIAPARIGEVLEDGMTTASLPDHSADLRRFRNEILRSLDDFDREGVERALRRGLLDCDIETVGEGFVNSLLRDLRIRWRLDHSISEQRLLECSLRNVLANCGTEASADAAILATTLPDEPTDIGLLLWAIIGRRNGLSLTVLGPGTPLAELAAARNRARAPAILLFTHRSVEPSSMQEQLAALATGATCRVFVAGPDLKPSAGDIQFGGAIPLPNDPVAGLRTIAGFFRRNH